MSKADEYVQMLKAPAKTAKAGKCIDCRFFMGAENFQKFGWFGLRKDVETSDSIMYAKCVAHLCYASTAFDHLCRGKSWEPK